MTRIRLICFVFTLLLCVSCGGGSSDTNGVLSLDVSRADQTGGKFNVVALATYSPPSGKVANGLDITLTANIHTFNGTPVVQVDKLSANTSGTVTKSYNINQVTGPIYVDVTASTGGLVITKSTTVPSLASLTTTPSTVAFPIDALAGVQQTVTIAGGTSPFTASMDSAHVADMLINVNGTTITLTKKNNSGQNPVLGAQLTISDNSGNSVTIPVGYN